VDDGLHRLIVQEDSSPAQAVCKRFQYDSATGNPPSGSTISNVAGQLAQAETDNCAGTSLTDEWFSYDADGRPTDLYESTPNSGGYYHTTVAAGYHGNGVPKTLGLLNSGGSAVIPTMSFVIEGEGRPTTVSASYGQNPVTGVTYTTSGTAEPIGSLTNVTFGSGDSDSFEFYTTTGRMEQYKFNVDGQSASGTLTWNANGTLGSLVITDPFNSEDNGQTCTYGYDALARISGVNCTASLWGQSFTYDAFGNITKQVPSGYTGVSWMPSYNNPANNQYQSGWENVSYDASGDLLNDTFNTYTWNGLSIASVNGETITNDAFGRMVENKNGANQFVYPPMGGPSVAVMNGQNLDVAIIPLPGGANAVYIDTGVLDQYNHPDWLGSARLYSGTVQGNQDASPAMAYAPFGEGYAGGIPWVQFAGAGDATVYDNENQTGSLVDFFYRRYSPTQGRWISPDPAGLAAADPTNPQSWNRYAYVLNNPLSNIDPLGLDCVFLNEDGSRIEEVDADTDTSPSNCTSAGVNGYYVPGVLTGYATDNDGTITSLQYAPFSNTNGVGYDGPQPDSGSSNVVINYNPQQLSPAKVNALVSQNNRSNAPNAVVNCIIGIESSGNPQAVPLNSNGLATVGATPKGLMQVGVAAAQDVINQGLAPSGASTAPQVQSQEFNPAFNIQLGTAYLQVLMNRYGSLALALQHYGPNEPGCATAGQGGG
jgi:RHS repeat-associated protein